MHACVRWPSRWLRAYLTTSAAQRMFMPKRWRKMVSLDGVSLKRTGTQTISAPVKSKSWLKIRGGICRRTSSGFRLIRSPGRLLGFHGPGSPAQKGCILGLLCDSRQLLDVCNEAHYSFHMFSVWRRASIEAQQLSCEGRLTPCFRNRAVSFL